MKRIIIIASFFLPAIVQAKPSFKINILTCRSYSNADKFFILKLYRNNVLSNELHFTYGHLDTTLTNLDTGLYRYEYVNIFKRTISDTIHITEDKLYSELICLDEYIESKDSYNTLIGHLQDKEKVVLTFELYACYRWWTQDLKISREGDKYYATLYPQKHIREKKREGKTIKRLLSANDLSKLLDLEKYIYTKASMAPHNYLTFTLKYKNESWAFGDVFENFDYFDTLKEELFR